MSSTLLFLDKRFHDCISGSSVAECLWSGGKWVEGPVWISRTNHFIWSDIPNNRMMCWHSLTGETRTFRQPSNGANGNTADKQGRLLTCEQYSRRISRTEHDGTTTILVDQFEGKRFNAPNDIVVKSDDTIWFSDPDYGQAPEYEGTRELAGCHIYCLNPETKEICQMTDDLIMPNGLAFSPDEQNLYVIDTGSTHMENGPNHIRRFDVNGDSTLSAGEVFAENRALCFDGMRLDIGGRLWCSAEDGVHCYDADGTLIGKIVLPERAGNVCFGGKDSRTLFVCDTSAVFQIQTQVVGI